MRYICGIDIGESKIAGCVGIFRKRELLDLWWASCQLTESPNALLDSLNKLLNNLKKKSNVHIQKAYFGITGSQISPKHSSAVIPIADYGSRIISSFHLKRLEKEASLRATGFEEEILYSSPQGYVVNKEKRTSNPLGLYGHKLSLDLYLICAKTLYLNSLTDLAGRAGLKVEDFIPAAVAQTKLLSGSKEEKEKLLLCDIGRRLTQLVMFEEGRLLSFKVVDIGGDYLTEQLSHGLNIPYSLAEKIKLSYGYVQEKNSLTGLTERQIIIRGLDDYHHLSQSKVVSIISQASKELICRIGKSISRDSYKLYATGGTVLLDGFLELLENHLNVPVRLVKIESAALLIPEMRYKLLSNQKFLINYFGSLALLFWALDSCYSNGRFSKPIKNIWQRIKEIYEEYF